MAGEIQSRMGTTMRRHMRAPRETSDLERARLRLRGVGLGYVAFARAEPAATGGLSPDRRPHAEFVCWAAVHGCAELLIHGPLRDADTRLKRSLTERIVDDIIAGVHG